MKREGIGSDRARCEAEGRHSQRQGIWDEEGRHRQRQGEVG